MNTLLNSDCFTRPFRSTFTASGLGGKTAKVSGKKFHIIQSVEAIVYQHETVLSSSRRLLRGWNRFEIARWFWFDAKQGTHFWKSSPFVLLRCPRKSFCPDFSFSFFANRESFLDSFFGLTCQVTVCFLIRTSCDPFSEEEQVRRGPLIKSVFWNNNSNLASLWRWSGCYKRPLTSAY